MLHQKLDDEANSLPQPLLLGTQALTSLDAVQREVQRKLGRCLIRLQQYERLLKALLPTTDFQTSWQPGQVPQTNLQAATERLQSQTLGQLMNEFIGIHSEPRQDVEETDEESGPEGVFFSGLNSASRRLLAVLPASNRTCAAWWRCAMNWSTITARCTPAHSLLMQHGKRWRCSCAPPSS
ncbi:hypothetical protein HZU83_10155 [Sphaerotilus montanus]|uniref:Uncharacterized protein n=1 Tax=Sphaerotilus montanus TaxID=522889 RepID=A0A7Y9UC27_9BURK|nr:hypothetical protein [Sphaerotilus montanus]NYG33134.1 hypothetical protein [Sphaerotilus montanus]NZD57047.1 hypothetical protein [Sphaerotilus montanus]